MGAFHVTSILEEHEPEGGNTAAAFWGIVGGLAIGPGFMVGAGVCVGAGVIVGAGTSVGVGAGVSVGVGAGVVVGVGAGVTVGFGGLTSVMVIVGFTLIKFHIPPLAFAG